MKKLWLCLLFVLAACSQVECDDGCLLDLRECAGITSDTIKDTCYAERAIELNNQSMCDMISSIKTNDYCVTQFIKQQSDYTLCEELNSDTWIQNCYNHYAANNSDLCSYVKDSGQCYYEHALSSNSSALCYNATDTDRCLYKVAIATYNTDLCMSVEGLNQYTCHTQIAVKLNNSELCNELPETWANHCAGRIE